MEQPSMRLGSLPFPGPFSLFAAADPESLGHHDHAPFMTLFNDEESRGILYTCQAGFLDLSHIRDSIDLARHFYVALGESVRNGKRKVVVLAFSPCRYHITIDLPNEWAHAKGAETLPVYVEDAVIELSVQLTWIATTWYEVLQWAGYSSTIIVPEDRSAFTYDDLLSHAIGGDIARKSLHESTSEDEFNAAATKWLAQLLEDLEIVSPDEMHQAVELVRGKWWAGFSAVRRQLDIGLDDGTVRPWLVRGLERCDHVDPLEPEPYVVPPLLDSLRPDGKPLASVEIEMRILEASRIRATIPDRPRRIVPHRDFPHIMEGIRRDMVARYGEDVDRPYAEWELAESPSSHEP
jgi:hypothetical protein